MDITIRGEISVPGDKSISHRAVMFGAIADGTTEVRGFLDGADCRSTISCFRKMGIAILHDDGSDRVTVHGKGLYGLSMPKGGETLDVGNSGTTTRLIAGILAGQGFPVRLSGDDSIQARPMKRIMDPLREMGADIASERGNDSAPLLINYRFLMMGQGASPGVSASSPISNYSLSSNLRAIHYTSPVASAQVKSCVLLAGLYADGVTSVSEPKQSRNHTETMLKAFGAGISVSDDKLTSSVRGVPASVAIRGNGKMQLHGQKILVPGDISSAAYFIAAALLSPRGDLLIKNVNTNPTRAGILDVVKQMGGNISLENKRVVSGEDVADLHIVGSVLHGTEVSGDIIPALIDEIPMIAVLAAFADGETIIRDAKELKVKESDRIATVTENLKAMGADITPTDDGMIIRGGKPLHTATIKTYHDHRIAMSFAIANLFAEQAQKNSASDTTNPLSALQKYLDDAACVAVSYPTFFETLASITEY